MSDQWLAIANKMAEAARAALPIERERLNKILAERQQRHVPVQSQQPSSKK
jgi:hypothetical protein